MSPKGAELSPVCGETLHAYLWVYFKHELLLLRTSQLRPTHTDQSTFICYDKWVENAQTAGTCSPHPQGPSWMSCCACYIMDSLNIIMNALIFWSLWRLVLKFYFIPCCANQPPSPSSVTWGFGEVLYCPIGSWALSACYGCAWPRLTWQMALISCGGWLMLCHCLPHLSGLLMLPALYRTPLVNTVNPSHPHPPTQFIASSNGRGGVISQSYLTSWSCFGFSAKRLRKYMFPPVRDLGEQILETDIDEFHTSVDISILYKKIPLVFVSANFSNTSSCWMDLVST